MAPDAGEKQQVESGVEQTSLYTATNSKQQQERTGRKTVTLNNVMQLFVVFILLVPRVWRNLKQMSYASHAAFLLRDNGFFHTRRLRKHVFLLEGEMPRSNLIPQQQKASNEMTVIFNPHHANSRRVAKDFSVTRSDAHLPRASCSQCTVMDFR